MDRLIVLAALSSILSCSSKSPEESSAKSETKVAPVSPATQNSGKQAEPAEEKASPTKASVQKTGEAFCKALVAGSNIPPDDVKLASLSGLGEETRLSIKKAVGFLREIKDCKQSERLDVDKLAMGSGWYFDPVLGLEPGEVAYVHPSKGWVMTFSFAEDAPLVPSKILLWEPQP